MVGAVIKQLQNDQPDFTTIEDPYGSKPFEYQPHVSGFTLVSELQHHSRIDFRFGSAVPSFSRCE